MKIHPAFQADEAFLRSMGYDSVFKLPDERWIAVHPSHPGRLFVHVHRTGYEEHYCFATSTAAIKAAATWRGEGDPEGWVKHATIDSERWADVAGHERIVDGRD